MLMKMNNNCKFRRTFIRRVILSALLVSVLFFFIGTAYAANPYLNSAHGDATAGVKRSAAGFPADYPTGHCAHCHEQHASINGAEPAPAGGPDDYLLFDENYSSQTVNFCFDCHTDLSSYQSGGIINRSYSYRAGDWDADSLNDILEAFSYAPPGTSHSLDDIKTFITGKWGYTSDSNPCAACHNPHSVQGDPENSDTAAKSSGSRGWPVSRPSMHSKDNNAWGLWGDDATERMSNYTANYQAPYRYYTVTPLFLEPQGDLIADPTSASQNTTDFVTFCTDCHNHPTDTIYSTRLGRDLAKIDWSTTGDKHGQRDADGSLCGDNPYPSGAAGLGKVLSCTDCHEPHGSPNAFMARNEINGGILGGSIGSFSTTDWHYLCDRCHNDDKEIDAACQEDHWNIIHHRNTGCNTEFPYNLAACASCHTNVGGPPPPGDCNRNESKLACTNCHYHGSEVNSGINNAPLIRRTF
jgi:hypothetical protein